MVEGLKKAGKDLNRAIVHQGPREDQRRSTRAASPSAITYGPDDHIGLSATRPYSYDYDTKKFEAIGEFADYAAYITNEYAAAERAAEPIVRAESDMVEFFQYVIGGLAIGSIYGLVALGFVLIFKSTDVFNFAQGDLLMVGGYLLFTCLATFTAADDPGDHRRPRRRRDHRRAAAGRSCSAR